MLTALLALWNICCLTILCKYLFLWKKLLQIQKVIPSHNDFITVNIMEIITLATIECICQRSLYRNSCFKEFSSLLIEKKKKKLKETEFTNVNMYQCRVIHWTVTSLIPFSYLHFLLQKIIIDYGLENWDRICKSLST